MLLETKNLGKLEYEANEVVRFDKGLLGFENFKDYLVVKNGDTEFYYLQPIDDLETTFVMVDLKDVMPNYNPEVEVEQLKELGEIGHNLGVFNICTVPDHLEEMTVNLLGPVVINMDTKKGKQVVVTKDEYAVKHRLFS